MSDDGTLYESVDIISKETHEVITRVHLRPPKGERMANKTEDGININLDHERFYTDLVEASG